MTDEPTPQDVTDATDATDPQDPPTNRSLLNRNLLYPNAYVLLLILSAMDVMLTWMIIRLGGSEVNPIADGVIDLWGLNGMIVYKFVLIAAFISMCESVGSLREPAGRSLSRVSLLIASVPVAWSMVLLSRYVSTMGP